MGYLRRLIQDTAASPPRFRFDDEVWKTIAGENTPSCTPHAPCLTLAPPLTLPCRGGPHQMEKRRDNGEKGDKPGKRKPFWLRLAELNLGD